MVWRAQAYRTLGLTKPRSNGQSKSPQPFAPHIDAQFLLQSESKAWNAMVKHRTFDPKFLLVEEQARR